MARFLTQQGGQLVEAVTATEGGAGNADRIPSLDANGRLHPNMMPAGLGADTASVEASEALVAGDLVNIWDDGGSFKVRKADAPTNKPAHGFVLGAFASGVQATVYFEGVNTQLTGLTAGRAFLGAAGAVTNNPPTTSGYIVQQVGVAVAATSLNFEAGNSILLA